MPRVITNVLALGALTLSTAAAAQASDQALRDRVHAVMQQYDIPGMAIGITNNGEHHFYTFGQASRAPAKAVSADTLFEIGSISKTFTATLAAVAQTSGALDLSDSVAKRMPALAGSAFGGLSLLELATHTTGGMPLQVPDAIANDEQLLGYLRSWQPQHQPGTWRAYSNISIGMLGVVAAQALQQPFDKALAQRVFQPLAMQASFVEVPASRLPDYAYGYTQDNRQVRVNPGPLANEAYGIKTSARDLLRFVDANLGRHDPQSELGRAIALTHTGYYQAGPFTQDLIWEHYRANTPLEEIVSGNDPTKITYGLPAKAIIPAMPAPADSWINKTGSTTGFGAYVAFVPGAEKGIVILANKNYPNAARVRLAHALLE